MHYANFFLFKLFIGYIINVMLFIEILKLRVCIKRYPFLFQIDQKHIYLKTITDILSINLIVTCKN